MMEMMNNMMVVIGVHINVKVFVMIVLMENAILVVN